jgi:hypothetical protein
MKLPIPSILAFALAATLVASAAQARRSKSIVARAVDADQNGN